MTSILTPIRLPGAGPAPIVLVVDDDDAVRNLVETVLSDEGYRVWTAENGREALALLGTIRPALILMDVNMPRLDGLSACQLIHGDARTATLPVIIMSARPLERAQLRDCRADGFLPKPFDLDRLIDEVAAHVGAPIVAGAHA